MVNDTRVLRADRLFSMLVRQRDRRCRRCFAFVSYDELQCHHFIKRRHMKTRYLMANGAAVCPECHALLEDNPKENEAFAISVIGEARWNDLRELARDTLTKVDLDEVLEDLRKRAA